MGNQETRDKGPQVVQLPAEREGESQIYRHVSIGDKPLLSQFDPNVKTLYEAFAASAQKYPNNRCLGYREGESPYKWLSYKVVRKRALDFGSGLHSVGIKPHEDKIGIYSLNRVEWSIAEQASNAFSLCVVPLYETLGPDAVAFIINQAEIHTVVCSSDKIEKLASQADKMPCLKCIVSMDTPTEPQSQAAEKAGLKLHAFSELEEAGAASPVDPDPPKPEEYSTICYTSGDPKGVILTHANFIADIAGAFVNGIKTVPTDVHISYLPLAHVLERVVMNALWCNGAAAGFFRGDVRLLFDDITELKPTLFVSVPRVWNRLYDKVMAQVKQSGALKEGIFQTAYAAKQEGLKEGYITHAVWDSVVFSAIREKLGGNVRLMVTGSAPLSSTVMEFLRICFSCPVVEGYGQTETSGGATTTLPDETELGNVGVPLPCIEVKLVDVPEMGYKATDQPYPRGEICFRGPCVTQGYYKNEAKTKETIDENGWLHSGDVGVILENGHIRIIDRAKNIFKLSHGEYIAPEKLENVYVQSKYVLQNFVHGESIKSSLVAVVVPDPEVLKPWALENGKEDDMEKLCADPEVNKIILEDMLAAGKANQLRGFEFIKKIHLTPTAFSVDNDLLTPTFKLKRPQAQKAFADELADMYKDLD